MKKVTLRVAFICGLLAISAGSAQATSGIFCTGGGAEVSVEMGFTPFSSIVSASIKADGQEWSTGADTLAVGQDFSADMQFKVDFTDIEFSEVIARLRLTSAVEGDDRVTAGTLQIGGKGAYAVICEDD